MKPYYSTLAFRNSFRATWEATHRTNSRQYRRRVLRTALTFFYEDGGNIVTAPAPRKNSFAWAARCDCRNDHASSSGRCNARDVTDPTRTKADNFAACERCRANCPCGQGQQNPLAAEQEANYQNSL